MNTGQNLYKKAKKLIPGGTMLLSKRPEMFLPEKWPSYYSKAEGCHIWDLDGNKYTDVSIMGIGTNILGYGNKEIDEVVTNVIKTGNMSTFNCPGEVFLGKKIIHILGQIWFALHAQEARQTPLLLELLVPLLVKIK
ncbi:hypothetical protein PL371_11495 [Tenacibaculum maritimum]|nr:hypothetical protein [Tenacibaculum maritimum]MDB0612483.1 hypothetical protein [Tenacibaculum maritimum]